MKVNQNEVMKIDAAQTGQFNTFNAEVFSYQS